MKSSPDLERLLDELDAKRAFLVKLIKGLRASRRDGAWDAVMVERTLQNVEKAPALDADLRLLITATSAKVESDASRAVFELDSDLRDLCSRRGWSLDGAWPKLCVERAIDLEVDEKRRTILIGDTRTKAFGINAIEQILDKQIKGLLPRNFDAAKFIADLARAYDEVSTGGGREAPILHVYREMLLLAQPAKLWRDARSASFAELTANQFRARLSAALESGDSRAPDGRELRLLPPIDPKEAMFVYQPAEKRFGFVGRIEFRATDQPGEPSS